MDLYVLNKDFDTVAIFDVYESFIWTDRYDECGDFEAYFSPHSEVMEHMVVGNYIWRRDSEHLMIIKRIEITTDPIEGPHAIVTGESLESILKDRVIAQQTVLTGNFQNGIKTLLDQTIISPKVADRKIPNFIFKESIDPAITGLKYEAQYFGENLYTAISAVCYDKHVGFKVTLDESNQFVFELYAGVDRSYEQNDRPYIIFSPRYDNLLNSNYVYDVDNVRNVAYIMGEEDTVDDTGKVVTPQIVESTGSGKGLERKEIFVDASSSRRTYRNDDGEEVTLSDSEYRSELKQRGAEELAEYYAEEAFDGQIQGDYQWIIGQDYFMGDIVEVENEYGRSAKCRIVEMITSDSTSGTEFYPSFESVSEEEK